MAKQAQTLTRDAIQYETKHDFSKSQHSKQTKRFLATATALNTNETSKYTYELILTSADRLLLSKTNTLSCLTQQMAMQAQILTRDVIQYETKRDSSKSQHSK